MDAAILFICSIMYIFSVASIPLGDLFSLLELPIRDYPTFRIVPDLLFDCLGGGGSVDI